MLDLSTAVLCDFAQVRDRLLFVSSGAVSRLYRQELPSPLGLMVGLVIEVPLEDAGMEHRLRAEVINRHGTVLATLENLFRVSDEGLFPHEVQQVPLVLSITGVRARTWGTHQVRLYLDDDLVRALTLYVVPAAGPQAVVRATPTQSRVADDEGSLGGTGTDGVDAPAPDGEDGTAIPNEDAPGTPLPWGAPVGAPSATAEPTSTDDDQAHEIVIDLATADEDPELVTIVPEGDPAPSDAAPTPAGGPADEPPAEEPPPAPASEPVAWEAPAPPAPAPWDAPAPEPEERSPWDAPAPAPAPSPTEAQAPAPSWEPPAPQPAPSSQPTIAAPRAEEPAPLFDFDEDDLDADPAQRTRPVPTTTPSAPDPEKSRFSFRYRYDDDEDSPS